VRHAGLDGEDAGGGGVFAGFAVGVEEVGGAGRGGFSEGSGGGEGGGVGYRVSSGRDMLAVAVAVAWRW